MEDLTEKIADMLSDPEMMNNLQSISGLLGLSSGEQCEDKENSEESSSGFPFSPEMLQMIMKIIPILSSLKKEDKYTKFLEALKPLLSEEKRKKLESSSHILLSIFLNSDSPYLLKISVIFIPALFSISMSISTNL